MRTLAMAAGLTDHQWSLRELLRCPAISKRFPVIPSGGGEAAGVVYFHNQWYSFPRLRPALPVYTQRKTTWFCLVQVRRLEMKFHTKTKRRSSILLIAAALIGLSILSCNLPAPSESGPGPATNTPPPVAGPDETPAAPTEPGPPPPPPPPSGDLIQPADLAYLGAFRLPADAPDEIGWLWSGEALAYYPDGDPGGPDDGFPGSLFGSGHNWNQYVSEINIPIPVNSTSKDVTILESLPT